MNLLCERLSCDNAAAYVLADFQPGGLTWQAICPVCLLGLVTSRGAHIAYRAISIPVGFQVEYSDHYKEIDPYEVDI